MKLFLNIITNKKKINNQNTVNIKKNELIKGFLGSQHGYHLVKYSPWPVFTIFALFFFLGSIISLFNGYRGGPCLSAFSFLILISIISSWIRDILREISFVGKNTWKVRHSLIIGIALFILSEIMFFSGFFWAFFHSSIISTIWLFEEWPPQGIIVLQPTLIPLVNTLILLLSGVSVTWAHQELLNKNKKNSVYALSITIGLGCIFTCLQIYEYLSAYFNLSDGVYPSVFYLATAFHGLHVIIGIIFLSVCLKRLIKFEITPIYHLNFEFAAWYWHFVDVVWLFLFSFVYIWGGEYLYKY